MTTPPRVRRFNVMTRAAALDARQSQDTGRPDPGEAAAKAPAAGGGAPAERGPIRVELRKKADLPPGFGKGPLETLDTGNDSVRQGGGPTEDDAADMLAPPDDGFGDRRFPTAGPPPAAAGDAGTVAPAGGTEIVAAAPLLPADAGLEAKLAAIRAEGLTERQLRIARRIATLHQIEVTTDEEAVLRLRERGIDPSHRAAVTQILSAEGQRAQAAPSPTAPTVRPRQMVPAPTAPIGQITPVGQPLPGTPLPGPALPSRERLTEDKRAAEIIKIQRDMARRRRRRFALMMTRLAFFVFLPTVIAGWYYFVWATPMYSSYSQFQIQQADSSGSAMGAGLLAGSAMQTNTDYVSVQSYLTSRDAMLRLDEDLGFKRAFQDAAVDPLQRLAPDATMEETYGVYKNSVKIGYDPTEGVINMEVIAPNPALSEDFSLALIRYAEGQVDQLTARLRSDQMEGAIQNYSDAEAKVREAQADVQALQEQMGVLDAQAEGGLVMGQISRLEGELTEKQLSLAQYLDNPRPNQSRVDGLRADISRLEQMIAETRAQLTVAGESRASLATITGQLRIAEGELETRQQLLASAAENMEVARIEANKQVRFLSLLVAPVPPDEASYPKAFQNTLVAFFIFSGIYLMLSLTASILREQVSA